MLFKRIWSDEEGVIAPIAIMLMIILIGFCAFVLDVGNVFAVRRSLQNAADAAALAGARDLEYQIMGDTTRTTTTHAQQAQTYAAMNGVPAAGGTCAGDGSATVTYNGTDPTRPNSWQVSASRQVPLTFGGALGIQNICVSTTAVAVVTDANQAKLFPFALFSGENVSPYAAPGTNQVCDPNAPTLDQYCFTLKEGSSGSASGNFGILDFLCTGNQNKSSNYVYWTENGYGSRPGETIPVAVPPGPWTVCTFTGNTASANSSIDSWITTTLQNPPPYCPKGAVDPTYTVPDFRCPLIGLLPILRETTLGTGSSGTVNIINFAIFEMVGLTNDQATGHQAIVGEFLQWAAAVGPSRTPDPSGQLTGDLTIRLVQ